MVRDLLLERAAVERGEPPARAVVGSLAASHGRVPGRLLRQPARTAAGARRRGARPVTRRPTDDLLALALDVAAEAAALAVRMRAERDVASRTPSPRPPTS